MHEKQNIEAIVTAITEMVKTCGPGNGFFLIVTGKATGDALTATAITRRDDKFLSEDEARVLAGDIVQSLGLNDVEFEIVTKEVSERAIAHAMQSVPPSGHYSSVPKDKN